MMIYEMYINFCFYQIFKYFTLVLFRVWNYVLLYE